MASLKLPDMRPIPQLALKAAKRILALREIATQHKIKMPKKVI